MNKKHSDIKLACQQILVDFAENRLNWKYVKSKRCFVRPVSKSCFVDVYTGMSSKVDFVKFEFGIHVGHLIKAELSKSKEHYAKWLIYWHRQRWDPAPINNGRCTVYDPQRPDLELFNQLRDQGKPNYVRLEDFPERLTSIFTLAEAEIEKLFDLSSEEALVRSLVDKPIGLFRPNEVLLVQLLLDNPSYYDELVGFYSRSLEDIRSSPYRVEPFRESVAEQLMARYRQGDFPKFDFA